MITYFGKSSIVNTNLLTEKEKYQPIRIDSIEKIQERMCYDSTWHIYTDLGIIKIKMYDGMSESRMKELCQNCTCINAILDLSPKYFYYD